MIITISSTYECIIVLIDLKHLPTTTKNRRTKALILVSGFFFLIGEWCVLSPVLSLLQSSQGHSEGHANHGTRSGLPCTAQTDHVRYVKSRGLGDLPQNNQLRKGNISDFKYYLIIFDKNDYICKTLQVLCNLKVQTPTIFIISNVWVFFSKVCL